MRLFSFVNALMKALEKRTIVWPEEWRKDIVDLDASLTFYSKELKAANGKSAKQTVAIISFMRGEDLP